jgi:hypothetical protein
MTNDTTYGRFYAEQRDRQEAESKRSADQAHRERIHAEVLADLEQLRHYSTIYAVEAIAAGRIRHLTINY